MKLQSWSTRETHSPPLLLIRLLLLVLLVLLLLLPRLSFSAASSSSSSSSSSLVYGLHGGFKSNIFKQSTPHDQLAQEEPTIAGRMPAPDL